MMLQILEISGPDKPLRGKEQWRPVTADDFRNLALSLPETIEDAHMGHPDFRVCGKIFATLGLPDAAWGMVKLSAEQQAIFVRTEPAVFQPAKGAWGRQGCTIVSLQTATETSVRQALSLLGVE